MTPEEKTEYHARRGTAEDISNLISIYSQLGAWGKGDLLRQAAEQIAEQRVRGHKTPEGKAHDAHDWLSRLAKDTYPSGHDGARLLQGAADCSCYGLDAVFGDGLLSAVLSSSEDERACGEGLYEGYMSVWRDTSPFQNLPAPAEFFGIQELDRDYEKYEYSQAEEEWKTGIYSQCIDELSGMVSLWRRDFFHALLKR